MLLGVWNVCGHSFLVMKIKIVGCGLTGIVCAVLLKQAGHCVEIFETRNHIGGNCYDSNLNGVIVHNYGPHIFHTNDEIVWNFLNQFTSFTPFKYAPLGVTKLGTIPLPYSLSTVKALARELSTEEIIEYIYKDYSEKQWGVPFDQISATILSRVPVMKNVESPSWFGDDRYQGIPSKGYTTMMSNMLQDIPVHLGVSNRDWRIASADITIYTGKVDAYFEYSHGMLGYRSLEFTHDVTSKRLHHHAINQCNKDVEHTREYDHSYFLNQREPMTVVTKEYPVAHDGKNIPFYPIMFGSHQQTYTNTYKEMVKREKNVVFVGRLATYKYLDMWVAIKQAMQSVEHLLNNS